MAERINFQIDYLKSINQAKLISLYQKKVDTIYQQIDQKKAVGSNNWMGWRTLALNYPADWIKKIKWQIAQWKKLKIKQIVVIGIGGSFLGTKAAIEMCYQDVNDVQLIWINCLSPDYIATQIKRLKFPFGIVVVSKSGTTLEPAVGFKIFQTELAKFTKNYHPYITVITDANKGILLKQAQQHQWFTLPIPDDIGGRFSMLTAVGMFVMMYVGLNYQQILNGAKQAYNDTLKPNLTNNSAALYACIRHYLSTVKKCQFENIVFYEPHLYGLGEQWKQMFCESTGKKHKGLFESASIFTTDLHSLGQYFQEGTRNFYTLNIYLQKPQNDYRLNFKNDPNFGFLNGKKLSSINQAAFLGTLKAHTEEGKIDNLIIELPKANAYYYGYLSIWCAMAVAIEGYLLNLNPFDQPGVEAYKKRMMEGLRR
ncbi:MAG: glucose-6-phosphate isomerase [Mycoplasmataceae bacterium]|nr:glucose-6-phosphate isomerase [Mycoplasmataceae bacterium]